MPITCEHDLDADQLQRDVGHRREDAGERDRERQRPAVVAALHEVGRRDVAVPVRDRPQPRQEQEDQRVDHDRVRHGEEADRAAGVQQGGHRDEGVRRVEVAADEEPGDERAEAATAETPLVEVVQGLRAAPAGGGEAEDRDQQEEEEEDAERDGADVAHRPASRSRGRAVTPVGALGEVVRDDGQHHRHGDQRELEPEVEREPEQRRVLRVVERHQQRQHHRGRQQHADDDPGSSRREPPCGGRMSVMTHLRDRTIGDPTTVTRADSCRLARCMMPMPCTDLSRYDDWLAWLRRPGRGRPRRAASCGSAAPPPPAARTSGPTSTSTCCAPRERPTRVHDRLLARIREDFDVDHVWELPTATWPDGRQCFVNLQHRPGALEEPTRIVDLHVSELSDAHRFVDVRRHGTPIVVHDPDGLIELRHDDEDAMRGRDRRGRRPGPPAPRDGRVAGQPGARAAASAAEAVDALPALRARPAGPAAARRALPVAARLRAALPRTRTCRPTSPTGSPRWCPGNGGLREQSAGCFAWTDELLEELSQPRGRVACRRALPRDGQRGTTPPARSG